MEFDSSLTGLAIFDPIHPELLFKAGIRNGNNKISHFKSPPLETDH